MLAVGSEARWGLTRVSSSEAPSHSFPAHELRACELMPPPPRVSLTIPPSSHTLVLMYLCVCECVRRNLLTGAQVCSSPYPDLAKSAVPTSGGVPGRGRRRRDCSTVVSRLAAELGGVFRVRPFVAVTGTISKRRREGAFVRQRAQGVSGPRACAGRVRRRLSGGRSGRLSGGGAVVVV